MRRALACSHLKLMLMFVVLGAVIAFAPAPAAGQAATSFGSNSGIQCPSGNVICNGSINFLTTELFFEPETPAQSLKEALVTWNEIEYLLDNPYTTGGGGWTANIGVPCRDGSGPQPVNEQGYPSYCTSSAARDVAMGYVRRPAFGVTHPVATSQTGAQTATAGLPPLRVHPINYNAPNGNEQRVLNPNFAGNPSFDHTGVCYTFNAIALPVGAPPFGVGFACDPTPSTISVSTGASRLDPTATPEIDYDTAYGAKPFYCQNNPEPVPLAAPFDTTTDSENYNICGSDPGEPGAAMPWFTTNGTRTGVPIASTICCEDNLGLPRAGTANTSWYSTPAVPAGTAAVATLRQIRARALCTGSQGPGSQACEYPTIANSTGASIPIQTNEWIVDPGTRGTIQQYDPWNGIGGLKKPTLRSNAVGYPAAGAGLNPNYVWNSAASVSTARPDPTGADIVLSNENDYYGLYPYPTAPTGGINGFYQRKQAARMEAARLGKSLFWDMQVGSDGVQSCGSCHAHAAADNRTKNQINPNGQDGIRGNPTNFAGAPNTVFAGPAVAANYDVQKTDFPFHKLTNPEIAGDPVCSPAIHGNTTGFTFPDGDPQQNTFPTTGAGDYTACDAANIVSDTEEVMSSMGVHFGYFYDIPAGTGTGLSLTNTPGATPVSPFGPASNGVRALIRDLRAPLAAGCTAGAACDLNVDPFPGFAGVGGPAGFDQFRRVEPRNTPTIDLAQFNFDNFWDARARHDDNGGSVFGAADPQSHVFVDQTNSGTLTATRQLIKFSSIASLAKGPALSKFEMSYLNRNWAKIGKKLLQKGVTPLANQLVDPTDGVLGPYSNQNGSACAALPAADRSPEGGPATALGVGVPGLCISYSALIRHAYYPALWQNTAMHLNGCYTDAYISDGVSNPAIAAVHPNQCGTGTNPAASITTLDPNGTVNPHNNDPFDTFVLNLAAGAASATDTNQFRQIEANFSLFWGQSINAWASFLVPDDTPFDQFADANPDVGMTTGEVGEPLLVLDLPMCGLNGSSPFPAPWRRQSGQVLPYVRDFEHGGCLREVGNFKRDPYVAGDIVGTPANPVQNDTTGHPRMSACLEQLTFNGETGARVCTHYAPAGGTRQPNTPDPLLGMDIFFGSNLSLKNPEFRSSRCGACHNAPFLTDHITSFTHKWTLADAAAEFSHDTPEIEPLMEPLSKVRIISAFHLESETNGPGQDAIERKVVNESIVPAALSANGNCTTGSCTGYSFPDAITYNPAGGSGTLVGSCTGTIGGAYGAYCIHADLGTGPIAGGVGVNGQGVPFTSFGGSFFDNGVYNIGVRPCVADYQGNVTGACEDTGRGNNDAFGWPMSLATLMMKALGGPAQQTGTPLTTFNPNNANAGGRADAVPCAPYCAQGGLFPLTGHDQLINSGYNDDFANPQIPPYIAVAASHITVGDSHPQLDEACGPAGGCPNTLSDVANSEGFPELGFDPRAHLSEVLNSAVATGDSTVTGVGDLEQGTWPVVNRVSRMGSFKAPQLREVELTGPYFHNGGKLTLRQVVDFYVRGGDFPVTNSTNRDFNILNLNAEIQSNLGEEEKVALVDFLLELTDNRVAFEKAPFDHPQLILPLDGTAPESDGTINRDAMLTGCAAAPTQFGPGQQFCAGNAAAVAAATGATGPLYLNVPAVGAAGNPGGRIPNFLGIAGAAPDSANPGGRQRLVGPAAFCGANITSQYCH